MSATKYPDSACEAHRNVKTSEPVCIICMANEIERLRRDCAEAYQIIGAAMLGEPVDYDQTDVVRVLDNLSAAANGMPRPHDDLLPWPGQPTAEVENA